MFRLSTLFNCNRNEVCFVRHSRIHVKQYTLQHSLRIEKQYGIHFNFHDFHYTEQKLNVYVSWDSAATGATPKTFHFSIPDFIHILNTKLGSHPQI